MHKCSSPSSFRLKRQATSQHPHPSTTHKHGISKVSAHTSTACPSCTDSPTRDMRRFQLFAKAGLSHSPSPDYSLHIRSDAYARLSRHHKQEATHLAQEPLADKGRYSQRYLEGKPPPNYGLVTQNNAATDQCIKEQLQLTGLLLHTRGDHHRCASTLSGDTNEFLRIQAKERTCKTIHLTTNKAHFLHSFDSTACGRDNQATVLRGSGSHHSRARSGLCRWLPG